MKHVSWMVLTVALLSMPAWAWNGYGPYTGGTVLQLRNELGQLERQVRDLQRQVDRLQAGGGSSTAGSRYPLPGQAVQGLRPAGKGAYAMDLNGSTLRFDADGGVQLSAAGTLVLEGAEVVTRDRDEGNGAAAGAPAGQ